MALAWGALEVVLASAEVAAAGPSLLGPAWLLPLHQAAALGLPGPSLTASERLSLRGPSRGPTRSLARNWRAHDPRMEGTGRAGRLVQSSLLT